MFRCWPGAAFGLTLATCLWPGIAVSGDPKVDLELVLAVDVSMSMDAEEIALQKRGYVEAFRSQEVVEAILASGKGRVAITYMEWAGTEHARFAVPWMLIETGAGAERFARALDAVVPVRVDRTSISAALAAAARSIEENSWVGIRQVIDVSGDGPNNEGAPLPAIRDELVAAGIVINGLAVMVKPGSQNLGIDNLDEFYRRCVIGGTGSFVLPVRQWSQFAKAIKLKLLQEISAIGAEAKAVPASAAVEPPFDCRIGEKIWENFIRIYGVGKR